LPSHDESGGTGIRLPDPLRLADWHPRRPDGC